jgi:RNA polymerase sigma-70 factor, ECF subfamily
VNRKLTSGVWLVETEMDAFASRFPSGAVSRDAALDRDFESRLADCPKLAYRVALGVLRNPAEAEDVAQEAMLRAYRNFVRLRDRERFRSWLVRMTWRIALDRVRAAKRRDRRERIAFENAHGEAAADASASSELRDQVAAALDALPEKLRIVLILAAIEGHNTAEMAKLLNVPEGTVKSRLFHARKRMAERLQWLVKNTPRC